MSSLTDAEVSKLAADLYQARQARIAIPPLTAQYPGLTMTDGYRVQQELVATLLAAGERVVGYKLGLTSAPMQQMLGVDSPDFAPVLSSHLHPDGAVVAAASFIAPRVEAEIALVLREDLRGPDCTVLDVAAAVSGAVPALEIVDSRIADWKISLLDTVADNASSGGFVVGQAPLRLDQLDLALTGCVFRRNGRVVATGAGAAVLGSPLHAATWLANELLGRGAELGPGHVILTGSITAAIPVGPGDAVTATFDHLGSVTAIFD